MADLNPNPSSTPPSANGFTPESDDISILLHSLLQSSNLPSSACLDAYPNPNQQQRPVATATEEVQRQFCRSAAAVASSADGIDEFDCESEDLDFSEMPRKSGSTRSSFKRTRAAEIHNLSEKRRRQRINEKLKALQKLIPNSNKTDKASMLDEAIEYLKQLQLQLQTLALRNGSALLPFYTTGITHSTQPTARAFPFNAVDGFPSSSKETGYFHSADQKIPMQNVYNPSFRRASSDQKNVMPMALETGNSECHFAVQTSTSTHCGPFNFVMPSKDLYGNSELSQLQLDVGCSIDKSSSGVSS